MSNNIFPKYSNYSILNTIDSRSIQYYKSDYKYLSEELKEKQKSFKEILTILENNKCINELLVLEQEICDEEINRDLLIHGQRHILDVLLFSMLLGIELLNKKDLELLLLAAKYHDSGRTEDDYQEHAYASSLITKEKLKDKISKEELSIVLTAIEFHEIPRKTDYEDRVFYDILEKNEVTHNNLDRTRKISEILKDADALDRTRFINRARLDNRYLYYDYSKTLIKFSADLQEAYALEDLNNYDYEETELEYNTPQELMRKIRKNIRTI